jgi:hypothetical protein
VGQQNSWHLLESACEVFLQKKYLKSDGQIDSVQFGS